MFKKRIIITITLLIGLLIATPVWGAVKNFKNDLPQKDWAKYGVNPWSLDTDNDGYTDAWEVKNGYCPTNYNKGVVLNNTSCVKGKIDYKNKSYVAPEIIQDNLPREVKQIKSCADLQAVLKNLYKVSPNYQTNSLELTASYQSMETTAANSDYSSTNIQVAGVDEADMVKTDGRYIFSISSNETDDLFLIITKATPVDQAGIVGKVKLVSDFSSDFSPKGLYLSGDFLLVIGSIRYSDSKLAYSSYPAVTAQIFNIKNKTKPTLVRSVVLDGSLLGSRVIGNYAYLVLNYSGYNAISYNGKIDTARILPKYGDSKFGLSQAAKMVNKNLVNCTDVNYLTPADDISYLEIVALPLNTSGKLTSKIVIGAGGSEIYMSPTNLYVASTRSGYWSWWKKEMTDIYKFSLNKGKIDLIATQAVPGTVLNQFSLDEKDGNLRLATTEWWSWSRTNNSIRNNLYVLDKNLNRIGWYENFGENERIYSARFMGDRAYVVTFRETDPLFVFDLKKPREPKLLGRLSIPGYSDYLHPYDENHLIGIGKQAIAASNTPGFAWYQGLKLGLFDVTDPTNPIEMFSREIGDRGSDSIALSDHHAFLFSKNKKLLAFPVSIYQLTEEQKKNYSPSVYGSLVFNGLYVYNLDLANGFSFLGGVGRDDINIDGRTIDDTIYRSFYIGNYLYVVSYGKISIHRLDNLDVVREVNIIN